MLEGEGFCLKLDDLVFPIKAGDSFVALAGSKTHIKNERRMYSCKSILVSQWHLRMY